MKKIEKMIKLNKYLVNFFKHKMDVKNKKIVNLVIKILIL